MQAAALIWSFYDRKQFVAHRTNFFSYENINPFNGFPNKPKIEENFTVDKIYALVLIFICSLDA